MNTIESPMPGNIWEVNVKAGDAVSEDDLVCILEAMKMENEIYSPYSGTIKEVHVKKGDAVDAGAALFTIDAGGDPASCLRRFKELFDN